MSKINDLLLPLQNLAAQLPRESSIAYHPLR
eukprot:COSAG02_NODE_56081_length_287_cov_0.824468_1_plen_30_part_10